MGLKIKLGTRVFPWEDLLTSDTPSPFLTLGDGEDIGFVLAVLAGMGPTVPKMLQTDAAGRLVVVQPAAGFGVTALLDGAGSGAQARIGVTSDGGTIGSPSLWSNSQLALFNNNTSERGRAASAAVLGATFSQGALLTSQPGNWSVVSTPAAGVQATATKAAGAAGIRRVCTGILVTFGAIAAPVATAGQWVLRDGASGAGTILMGGQVAVPAAVFQGAPIMLTDLVIPGTPATAMTLEFTAALANLIEGVTLLGFDAA